MVWRRSGSRAREDETIRAETIESINQTRALRERIAGQWPEVLEITHVTQPRLAANGFITTIQAAFEQQQERRSA